MILGLVLDVGGGAGWPGWLPDWGSLLRTAVTLGAVVAALGTVFKPFTREMLYRILKSSDGDREDFVMGTVNDADRDGDLMQRLFRAVGRQEYAPMYKTLIANVFKDEIARGAQTAQELQEVGRVAKAAASRADEMQRALSAVEQGRHESNQTNALLAQSITSIKEAMMAIHEEVKLLRRENDDTRRYVQDVARVRRELDERGMRERGTDHDQRGEITKPGRRREDRVAEAAKRIVEDIPLHLDGDDETD